jgi:hypothetical protein
MAGIDDKEPVLHRIRAKLYPNHFPNVDGNYGARTDNDRTLDTKDVCTAAKTRGGYPGDVNQMFDDVNWYHSELAYQLADGYAVTNDWFTISPHITGPFESPRDPVDPEKHKVTFRLSLRKRLRDLGKSIKMEIEGVADTNGFIDFLIDQEQESMGHNIYAPGNIITIYDGVQTGQFTGLKPASLRGTNRAVK